MGRMALYRFRVTNPTSETKKFTFLENNISTSYTFLLPLLNEYSTGNEFIVSTSLGNETITLTQTTNLLALQDLLNALNSNISWKVSQTDANNVFIAYTNNILVNSLSLKTGTLTESLVAYYKMDGNGNDASPNGYNGVTGASATTGVINQGLLFAANQRVVLPSAMINPFRGGNSMSVSCWIRPNSLATYRTLFHVIDNSPPIVELSVLINNTGKLFWADGTSLILTSIGSFPIGVYTHLTATFKNNGIGSIGAWKIYKNGILDNQTNAVYTPNAGGTDKFYIAEYFDGNRDYLGSLDEFGFWNKELSQDEVTELYNGGAGLPYSSF